MAGLYSKDFISGSLFGLLVFLICCSSVTGTQKDIQYEKGATVQLPCDVDAAQCGDLHSIKWYRGSARVFVFSHVAKIARPEGSDTSRMEVQYVPGSALSHLQIKDLQLTDEAVYKCEITYMEVRENCDVVQFVNLTTLVRPNEVRVTDNSGKVLGDGETLGPYNERDQVELVCEALGGKPVPAVSWYNGTKKMEAEYSAEAGSGGHGVGNGRSKLRVRVSRWDLRARYQCRVESEALPSPVIIGLSVDVNVRPTSLGVSGVESHVVQGSLVVLQCDVYGARPAANVTWYNGTDPVTGREISGHISPKGDGTYQTQSRLFFNATRFENGRSITCEAENSVMRDKVEPPMHQTIKLEVRYPPIVSQRAENITVNETVNILLHCDYQANPSRLLIAKWKRNGQELSLADKNHYEGGDTENPPLLIKNVSREDMGEYSCTLGNNVGTQESENSVYLNVHFKPIVELIMTPSSVVIENDRSNITLTCRVMSGNPETLLAVRWYFLGDILKELPECNNTLEYDPMCDIDPSKMFFQYVERQFAGNYSCEGMNEAGWGERSSNTDLVVYYPPSPAQLTFEPKKVIKKSSLKLSCSVVNAGQPEKVQFKWLRGTHLVPDITTSEWTINPVTLETESNFTCVAYNEGGDSESDTVFIEVYAPPTFISKLPPYHGALYNAKNISISCRIECSPLCNVTWLKNGRRLDISNTDLYYQQDTVIPPDFKTNDFESIHSALIWNMTAWPNEQLDRLNDNANYTCESTSNGVGGANGVKSTTYFAVEYPPENITLSNLVVNVVENHIPEKVLCSAKSHPEPSYQWKREGSNDIIVKGNKLIISQAVPRRDAGNYLCEAFNRHGSTTRATRMNVLFKPECQISQTVKDGNAVLVCSVKANPEEVDFVWKIKDDNDTVELDNVENNGLKSVLLLDPNIEEFRTYLCYANNSVGVSFPCERDVIGAVAWWKRLSNDELLIIVAVIVAVILCVIIICVIIIIVCRRKRASDKCPSQSNTADKTGLNPDHPSEALTDPDRGFYENLPFHGMQNPPNKLNGPARSDTYIY